MISIGVCESENGRLRRHLSEALRLRGMAVQLCRSGSCDILLWQDGARPPQEGRLFSRFLVVSGDAAQQAAAACVCRTVITAGLGGRDTLTASSTLAAEGGMASLQRELQTLSGRSIMPQEFYLERIPGALPDKLLILAALLLCG